MARPRLPRRLKYGEEATLVEHLGELRARILIALGAFAVAFVVAYVFHERLVRWLTRPLPDDKQLLTLGVTEPFLTSLKVSAYAAFALALPVFLYQFWSFVAPAFEEHAQRVVAVFVTFASTLFAAGLAFGYFVVLPPAIHFLTNFDEELYNVEIRANYYYSFVSVTLLAIALVFELPVFILALVRLRVLTADRLRRNRRLGYFLVVVAAVLLPTVDLVSLAFEVIPLAALYELSIWLAVLMERRWQRSGRLLEAAVEVDEQIPQHRHQRRDQEDEKQPAELTERQHRRRHQRRVDVGGVAQDARREQVALDLLDDEVERRHGQARLPTLREAVDDGRDRPDQ